VFGRRYITPIVNAFVRRYPKVNIDLLLVDRFTNLVEEGLDVAVRVGELPDSSLVAVPVGQARRVICASPDYLRRQGKPRVPQDVAAHRCVRFTGVAPRDEWDFRMGRREVAIPITSVISCNQIDSALPGLHRRTGSRNVLLLPGRVASKGGRAEIRPGKVRGRTAAHPGHLPSLETVIGEGAYLCR
jgi:DNA-binding transcriptional LysR family regulator